LLRGGGREEGGINCGLSSIIADLLSISTYDDKSVFQLVEVMF
jgi:hypothetical protein